MGAVLARGMTTPTCIPVFRKWRRQREGDPQPGSRVVMLIDDRFGEPRVRQLLPRWWAISLRASLLAKTATITRVSE